MMGNFYGEFKNTVTRDELQAAGDGIPIFTRNFEVASDCTVQRGMLMAAATPTGVYSLATAADKDKYFVIAREDFEPDAEHLITQGYSMGRFHSNKIITASTDTSVLDALQLELRRQNIHLVDQLDLYGHYNKWDQ